MTMMTDQEPAIFVRVGRAKHGHGVFAARRIRKGAIVGEVTGYVIDDPDYTSLYCIDLGSGHSLEPVAPFRFLNHCCEPNCELFVYDEDDAGNAISPHVYLEALTNIQPGVELTIDYSWPANDAIRCGCESPGCRGWIVAVEELSMINSRGRRRG